MFPAFKWLNRTFRLLYGNLTNASHLGKHERNWCFPVFHRTNERLAETSTKPEVEKQQNRSLLSTLTTRPVLERPGIGNFNNTRMFNSNLCPRANLEFSTSVPLPSNSSMVTYLLKVSSNIFFSLGFRFLL